MTWAVPETFMTRPETVVAASFSRVTTPAVTVSVLPTNVYAAPVPGDSHAGIAEVTTNFGRSDGSAV